MGHGIDSGWPLARPIARSEQYVSLYRLPLSTLTALSVPLSTSLSTPISLSVPLSVPLSAPLSVPLSLCTPLAMGVAWAARLGARELWWVGCWVAALLFSVFCLFLAFFLPLLPLRDHYKGSRVSQQATRGGSTGVCSIPARLGTSNQLPGKGKI